MTKSLWQKLAENKFAKIFSTDCRLERLVKSLFIKFLWKFFSRLPLQSTSDPENHMFSSSRLQVGSSRVLHACFVYILSCGSKGIVSTNHIQDIIPSRWIFNLQVFPRFKEPSTRSVSVEGFWRILGGKRASSHIPWKVSVIIDIFVKMGNMYLAAYSQMLKAEGGFLSVQHSFVSVFCLRVTHDTWKPQVKEETLWPS